MAPLKNDLPRRPFNGSFQKQTIQKPVQRFLKKFKNTGDCSAASFQKHDKGRLFNDPSTTKEWSPVEPWKNKREQLKLSDQKSTTLNSLISKDLRPVSCNSVLTLNHIETHNFIKHTTPEKKLLKFDLSISIESHFTYKFILFSELLPPKWHSQQWLNIVVNITKQIAIHTSECMALQNE